MFKIEQGFTGQRFVYLPQPMMELMADSPLSSDLYICSMGHYPRALYHYVSRENGCDEYLFLYCKSGSGWVEYCGTRYRLLANYFMILPPNVQYAYGADSDNPWTIYWFHFRGQKAPLYADNLAHPTLVDPSDDSRIEDRLDIFEEIYSVVSDSSTLESLYYANLCFAHFMASFIFVDVFRGVRRKREYSESMINRVVSYMNDNVENRLTLDEVALYAGYSKSYLHRKFVKETGYAPMDYFIRIKVNKACLLLIQTDMKINQIALKLGFRESQYFSRTFFNSVGLSPTEFRKQNFRL